MYGISRDYQTARHTRPARCGCGVSATTAHKARFQIGQSPGGYSNFSIRASGIGASTLGSLSCVIASPHWLVLFHHLLVSCRLACRALWSPDHSFACLFKPFFVIICLISRVLADLSAFLLLVSLVWLPSLSLLSIFRIHSVFHTLSIRISPW